MKWTKRETNITKEFAAKCEGYEWPGTESTYCLKLTQWQSGSGRYARQRVLPPFVYRICAPGFNGCGCNRIEDFEDYSFRRRVNRFFELNPRCAYCYAYDFELERKYLDLLESDDISALERHEVPVHKISFHPELFK